MLVIVRVLEIVLPEKPLNQLKSPADDQAVIAVVETWDEFLWTPFVNLSLATKLKEKDIVVMQAAPSQVPNMLIGWITKIIPDKQGERVWNKFKEQHKRNLEKAMNLTPPPLYDGSVT